ncbi:type II toxin-antitoxin system Phd/YefM family antitoxin [Cellulomonas sp. PhB150]|uniref:type II toxin-antitoxin system Phd/YefM family antitoxin n=1 Tax=Cellulomonas sp. PhB150 TaxID=2485188 RepID=UPI000F957E6F|nr:type II toxin-antitoxin system prevent-host-death family antitoxin [Cellulomonas sp. PhB150]ROS31237.1 prevent-host-death family protein [Cellulomonas sp. PhB150]
METTTVRRLSHDTAGVLALVATGHTVEVTRNGQPVARIVPVQPDVLAGLVASGALIAADPTAVRPSRLPAGPGPSTTEILDDLRSDRL